MKLSHVRRHVPARATVILTVLAFFGVFALGVIIGDIAPGDSITTFTPSNNITYQVEGDAVTVQDVTLARAEGTSMVPTYWPGNTLLMKDYTEEQQVKEGDIILYNNTGEKSAHRVIAAYPSQDRVIVKPDNQDRKQEITYSDIEYMVVGVLWN